jgi:formylglycine-generating enzyme required for sulfatase activity
MYHIHRILLTGSLTLFMAGCGGGDEESADTGKQEQATVKQTDVKPKAVSGANQRNPVAGATQRKQTAGVRNRNEKPAEDALPPGVEPEDVFLTDPAQNTFVVSATPEELSTFTIVSKPDEGADSSTFDLSPLRSQQRAEPEIERYARPPRISVATGEAEGTVGGLPEGFEIVEGSKTHEESGWAFRIRNKKDKSEFVLIPAGNTIRGSQSGPADTQPEHHVFLDSYYISVHEVTLRQWGLFQEAERENDRQRSTSVPLNEGDDPNMPALGIPQLEARKYAEWLHCDLPTEAQWEKAARGEQGFLYPWGNGRPIWSRPRDKQQILPVKSWRNDVSTYGVYDLAGNAREWTLDVYRDNWYAFLAGKDGEKLVENPTGPKPGAGAYDRVIRGGGDDWKVWHRDHARFSEKVPDVGYRLAINLKPAKAEENTEPEDAGRRRTRTSRR